MNRLVMALATVLAYLAATPASAFGDITRTEVLDRARSFVYYPFRVEQENLTAECVDDYESAYVAGDYMGVSYDWGGFASLYQFTERLADGYAAGTPAFGDVYWCTTGIDCSGFVSQSWHTNNKYATSTMHEISSEVQVGDMLPGDAFNEAGYHCTLYSHMMDSGEPYMYEAVGYNTHLNVAGGWSYVDGFKSRKFVNITGTQVGVSVGTLNHPIVVSSFPYADSGNTTEADSDLLDGCTLSGSNQSGREVVYQVHVDQPGQLTASVSDDAAADIDVHLYSSWNTDDCVARHDTAFTTPVDCGTYYVIADTFRSGGVDQAGHYDITIDFSPSGNACGEPDGYDFEGELGDACAYPGDSNLPFCNPTQGADVCLYTDDDSFCSTSCATQADCAGLGGGCCEEIASGESYCLTANLCSVPAGPDAGAVSSSPDAGPSQNPDPTTPGSANSGGCTVGGDHGPRGLWLIVLAVCGFWQRRRFALSSRSRRSRSSRQ